jgi:hypothetical protein
MKRYDEGHAPLAVKTLPNLKKYVRNHVMLPEGEAEPSFDCITEFWWEDRDAYEKDMESYASGPGQVLPGDEEVFMDRDSMVHFLVEEKVSDIPKRS